MSLCQKNVKNLPSSVSVNNYVSSSNELNQCRIQYMAQFLSDVFNKLGRPRTISGVTDICH